MFAKSDVKGNGESTLYRYLTSTGGEIKWNFTKFVVNRDGKILNRFEPAVKPDSLEMAAAIQKALSE